MRQGDHRRALAIVKEREVTDPLSADTRGLRLEYLVRTRSPEASMLADRLRKDFPDSPGVLFWCGRAKFLSKNYRDAEELFRESFRTAPYPSTEHWLGKTLTNMGRCDEAEPILTRLSERSPRVLFDLGWLYERKGENERALKVVQRFRKHYPENKRGKEVELKLKSRLVETDELLEEVDTLSDLGEEVPTEILPEVVEQLFVAGRANDARKLVQDRLKTLEPWHAIKVGWTAYHLGAFDLSYELFLAALPSNLQDIKLIKTLMRSARNAGRAAELAEVFDELRTEDSKYYGRAKTLRKWAQSQW